MNSLFTAYQCPWGSSAPLLRLPLILGLTVSTSPTPLFHHQTMGIQQWAPFTWHKAQKDSSECVVAYCNWRGGCYHHPLSFGMAHSASEHQHPDWQEIKVMLQGNEMLWCYHERQVIREPSLPIMRHPLPPWGKWEMSSEVFQLIQPFITAKKTLPEPPTWYVILKDKISRKTVFHKSRMCQLPKAPCKISHTRLTKGTAPSSWLGLLVIDTLLHKN